MDIICYIMLNKFKGIIAYQMSNIISITCYQVIHTNNPITFRQITIA